MFRGHWRKIVLTPDTHPQLHEIDLREPLAIGLSGAGDQRDAERIWLDEVKLLLEDDKGAH